MLNNKKNNLSIFDLVNAIIKDKYLIIIITFFFSIIFLFYANSLPKKFRAKIILDRPQNETVAQHLSLSFKDVSYENIKDYNLDIFKRLDSRISSISNFSEFIRNHSEYKNFLKSFKDKNITIEQYLSNNFSNYNDTLLNLRSDDYSPSYIFYYPEGVIGSVLLNEYVFDQKNKIENNLKKDIESNLFYKLKKAEESRDLFVEQRKNTLINRLEEEKISLQSYMDTQKRTIEIKLYNYKKALKIAKSIGLEDTIPTSILKMNAGSILNEPKDLFYKGSKVLELEIENTNLDLKNLDKTKKYNSIISSIENIQTNLANIKKDKDYVSILNDIIEIKSQIENISQINLNWNPILEYAFEPKRYISPKKSKYLIFGFIFGLIISLLVIMTKNSIKNKKLL